MCSILYYVYRKNTKDAEVRVKFFISERLKNVPTLAHEIEMMGSQFIILSR